MRVNLARADREAALAALREAGVEARAPASPWPLAAPEAIVISGPDRRHGPGAGRRRRR